MKRWKQWEGWGRPQKYTPQSLEKKAKEYFAFCEDKKNWLDKWIAGKVPKPKTLTGLCLWLEVSKDYISEKMKDEKFSETIKAIRCEVENDIEEWILQWAYHATAGIFNLKNNFDRKDKTEVVQETTATIKLEQVKELSDEDLLALTK